MIAVLTQTKSWPIRAVGNLQRGGPQRTNGVGIYAGILFEIIAFFAEAVSTPSTTACSLEPAM